MSVSIEDYIRVVYKLGCEKRPVRSVEVASVLGVTKPSVSGMLKNLHKKGLLTMQPYGSMELTKKGLALAKVLTYKHRVIENFVVSVLKMSDKEAHDEANNLEHAFSNKAIDRLYVFLKKPEKCPHGQQIRVQ